MLLTLPYHTDARLDRQRHNKPDTHLQDPCAGSSALLVSERLNARRQLGSQSELSHTPQGSPVGLFQNRDALVPGDAAAAALTTWHVPAKVEMQNKPVTHSLGPHVLAAWSCW
jgi:hypothetical protein